MIWNLSWDRTDNLLYFVKKATAGSLVVIEELNDYDKKYVYGGSQKEKGKLCIMHFLLSKPPTARITIIYFDYHRAVLLKFFSPMLDSSA